MSEDQLIINNILENILTIKEIPNYNIINNIKYNTLYEYREKNISIIFIEGCICAGKSTLIGKIKELIGKKIFNGYVEIVPEPLDVWLNYQVEGYDNILDAYYQDKETWAGLFQIITLTSRCQILKNIIDRSYGGNSRNKKIYIIERSPLADCSCFFKMNIEKNLIKQEYRKLYEMLYETFYRDIYKYIDGIIYLDANINLMIERFHLRNRSEENNCDDEYMILLNDTYLEWIYKKNKIETLILKINSNSDVEYTYPAIIKFINKLFY